LVLGIVYRGVCFPVFWKLLDKRGNSDTAERIELLAKFTEVFGIDSVDCLLADREFVGEAWFGYLIEQKLIFRIRLKENFLIDSAKPVRTLFRDLKAGQVRILRKPRLICGHWLYLAATKSQEGEYVIVAAQDKKSKKNNLEIYLQRWGIETLFGCLKSKGFNFEDTRMTDQKKISRLLSLLTIAFCWSFLTGKWLADIKPIKLKKHRRPARSIFRYGLDYLKNILFNLNH